MGTAQLLYFLNLVFPLLAVVCHSRDGFCCGDYCYVSRWNYTDEDKTRENDNSKLFVKTGCISGAGFASFKSKHWNGNERSFYLCDEYHCNYPYIQEDPKIYEEKFLADWKNKSLTCGDETNCNACSYSNYSYIAYESCHYGTQFYDVESFMQPQSCARFENDNIDGSSVECLCDTGDNCSHKLMEEQQLRSEKVTCHLDTRGNRTCSGDFCYIIHGESLRDSLRYPERGCITNNETLSPNLYQPGHFTLTFLDTQLVICDKNKCNKNFKKAKKYVNISDPSCPAPAITAT